MFLFLRHLMRYEAILKMKKIYSLLILAAAFFASSFAQAQQLSPTAQFSLLTITPGDDLYSCFGHSAILVEDSTGKFTKLYNYGTFDFDAPNFYWNFVRGKLKYMLSVENPRDLFGMAAMENRAVIQQVLNISPAQKKRLYDFLENNALPENRFYKYDFFYDNCSSRLRDAMVFACGDSLQFNLKPATEDRSFRSLIDPYLEDKRWQDLGMDLGMGSPADKIAIPYEYMFLPDYLMNGFSSATLQIDGKTEKLVSLQRTLLPNQPADTKTSIFQKPWFAFWILFFIVVAITFAQEKKATHGWWLDIILFTLAGLFGLVILFLWFFTDHGVTPNNMNLIWALPLHLIFLPMLLLKKNLKRVSTYFLANFFVLLILIVFWNYAPQELNANIIPFLMALAVRSMYIYYRIDKSLYNDKFKY